MLSTAETRPQVGRRPAAPGERTEALKGLLVIPYCMAVGTVASVRRLVRKARPLDERQDLALEFGSEPLKDVAGFVAGFSDADFSPRRGYGLKDFELVYAPDLVLSTLDNNPKWANRWFSCPAPFKRVVFESLDGTPLAAEVAFHKDGPRPGLVVTHGIFGSSGQQIYANPAITAFQTWGFNVCVLDLRGWGKSAALSKTPISGGWREGEDIIAAARYLMENGDTATVGGLGYSLGGASMLNAAAHDLAPQFLASGIISESGFTDSFQVMQLMQSYPGMLRREFIPYCLFSVGFRTKFRALGYKRVGVLEYMATVSAKHYGVTIDELHEQSSVIGKVDRIHVPTLQLHAEDDWIVKVDHALALKREADRLGKRNIGVLVRERGSHCAFSRVVPEWRERLAREFFSNTSGVRMIEGARRPAAGS